MKASYHLRVLEMQIQWSSAAKTYLVDCLERLIVAQSGCFDVLQPSREVLAACMYTRTYHRTRIRCVDFLKADISKFIRRTLFQRKLKATLKRVSVTVNSFSPPKKLLNLTIRPPATPIAESSTCNIDP